MAKRIWTFLVFAFAFSWITWFTALRFGAAPVAGEYILAFGAAGPAFAAILLSRRSQPSSDHRPVLRVLCFVMVWPLAWLVYLENDSVRGIHPSSPMIYRMVVGLLAFASAWIISGSFSRDSGVRQLLRTLLCPRTFLWPCVGLLFFPAILVIPAAVVKFFGGALVLPPHRDSSWTYLFQATIAFLNAVLFTAVLEEPGWRGFFLPHLQRKFSPLLASLLVWLPWSLWHAPLDFSSVLGRSWMTYVEVRVIFLIPIAITLTWLYNRSGGDLLSVAFFHAGMNTFPFVLPYAPKMLVLVFVWALFVIISQRMWRRDLRLSMSGSANGVMGQLRAGTTVSG
jgi:membrane protease YdiL (CAAX protease family)